MGYSFRLAARVLFYASSHRQDNTYHDLCYTSRGEMAGMRNSPMGPPSITNSSNNNNVFVEYVTQPSPHNFKNMSDTFASQTRQPLSKLRFPIPTVSRHPLECTLVREDNQWIPEYFTNGITCYYQLYFLLLEI